MTDTTPDTSITASELVVRRLAQHGIGQAFGVVGGAIMYITDALRRCEAIRSTFTHHEQGAAIAAEAYSKVTNTPALVFATAGPGTTNIITGVADAYMDSIPMVVLIGDVRSTIAADFTKQRYNAPQEVNQAGLMKPIVKTYLYLTPDMSAEAILSAVDATVQEAISGRPGPVCISMPLDVQGMKCDGTALETAIPVKPGRPNSNLAPLQTAMQNLLQARRPLLLLGAGVRVSGMADSTLALIEQYALPYCVTIGAVDLQDQANPLSCGCVGPTSQRAANLLFHASDCVLALATSFDQSVTGFNIADLIQNKKVSLVNVDSGENVRFKDANIQPIEADLADFFKAIAGKTFVAADHASWLQQVSQIKAALTAQTEAQMRTTVGEKFLSAYDVSAEISRHLPADATVVLGISLDAHSVFNSFHVTRGQRVLVSRNLGPMGWDVPALLGAALTTDHPESLVLITGDGSLMLNIQELAVIAGMRIPACIFVFNNDGYVSIRTTQSNFFGQQFFGCNTTSGLNIPPLAPLAQGFGLAYTKLDSLSSMGQILAEHKKAGVPRLVECLIDPGQLREPRLVTKVQDGKFKTPAVHDMTPALPAALADVVRGIFPQGLD
jgi:acetolactate synthase-1/2/3 large subunit